MKTRLISLIVLISLCLILPAYSATLSTEFISLPKGMIAADDMSAIAKWRHFLVVGSDESDENHHNNIQLLKKNDQGEYELANTLFLFTGNDDDGEEMDIEGIAVTDNTIFITGSHSLTRRRVKAKKRYQKNRKKFLAKKISDQNSRQWLYRLTMDSNNTHVKRKDKISLRALFQNDAVLSLFSAIPSKENGIDIEGIAVKNNWVYLGFRGPVFRGNYVPVMRFLFDKPNESYELLYVQLGGRGIRDMVAVSDGFLLLAGAVGDGDMTYQIYHWNGQDVVSGKDQAIEDKGKVTLLKTIIPPLNGKAEGLTVMQETSNSYQLMMVYDGIKNNNQIMQYRELKKLH